MQLKVIKNLISKKDCEYIHQEFDKLNLEYKSIKAVTGNSQNCYNLPCLRQYQKKLTSTISKQFNKNLGITYCYMRKYTKDSELFVHRDRPSCEYSLTLHINSSDCNTEWPIYFFINGKKESMILNQGDCCLYKGIEYRHGREKCPVDWYVQAFMHWIDLDGEYKEYHNDDPFLKGIK